MKLIDLLAGTATTAVGSATILEIARAAKRQWLHTRTGDQSSRTPEWEAIHQKYPDLAAHIAGFIEKSRGGALHHQGKLYGVHKGFERAVHGLIHSHFEKHGDRYLATNRLAGSSQHGLTPISYSEKRVTFLGDDSRSEKVESRFSGLRAIKAASQYFSKGRAVYTPQEFAGSVDAKHTVAATHAAHKHHHTSPPAVPV